MQQQNPAVTAQVENLAMTGCNFLPGQATKTLQESAVRIKCLSHADTLSDQALSHQIQIAQEQSEQSGGREPVATFALNLKDASHGGKPFRKIRDALCGVVKLVGENKKALICGLPNAGKSSLVLPLTAARTLAVRKKGAHHLPKVSKRAGRTLGMEKHVLDVNVPGLKMDVFTITLSIVAMVSRCESNHKLLLLRYTE